MNESLFDPASSLVGQTVDGRYELIDRLGGGGMGRVYKASRVDIGRTVAVKFLRAGFANRDEFVKRFEREVVTMGRHTIRTASRWSTMEFRVELPIW